MRVGMSDMAASMCLQGWEQYFFVARRTMHAMCCQAPAVFELLPDPTRTEVWPLDRHPPQCYVYRREQADPVADKADDIETEGADIGGEAVHVQLKDSLSDAGNVIRKDNYSIADFRAALGASLSDFEVCRCVSRGLHGRCGLARLRRGSRLLDLFTVWVRKVRWLALRAQ